jgi:hypothetical protein
MAMPNDTTPTTLVSLPTQSKPKPRYCLRRRLTRDDIGRSIIVFIQVIVAKPYCVAAACIPVKRAKSTPAGCNEVFKSRNVNEVRRLERQVIEYLVKISRAGIAPFRCVAIE